MPSKPTQPPRPEGAPDGAPSKPQPSTHPVSPASTLPMFRDEVDDDGDAYDTHRDPDDGDTDPGAGHFADHVPPGNAAASFHRRAATAVPVFGKTLRPPALIVDELGADREPTKLGTLPARLAAPPAKPAPPPAAPRITRAGPVPRVEHVEKVTQIGPVMRTERVPRSELARADRASSSELVAPTHRAASSELIGPAHRTSSSELIASAHRAVAVDPPAPGKPVARAEPVAPARVAPARVAPARAEPVAPARAEPVAPARVEPALRPPGPPSASGAPGAPAALTPPAVEPPRTEPRSWSGQARVPDLSQVDPRTFAGRGASRKAPDRPADKQLARPAGKSPASAERPARPVAAAAPAAGKPKHRSTGESIARLLYFAAGGLLAAAVAVYGGRLWHQVHPPPPPPIAVAPVPTAALITSRGHIELSADRRTVTRLAGDAPQWNAPLPAAADALELTGPLVLAHAADEIIALDLDSGRTRFAWTPPPGEHWATQHPAAVGDCLLAITTHDHKTAVRCLDLATGIPRWPAAALAGDHDCVQPAASVPGAIVLACSGWTAVLDDRTGAVSVMAGALGLVQDQPPTLLRGGTHVVTMPWSAAKRRFTQTGDVTYGATTIAAASAVLHKDRLVLRAVDSSEDLAAIVPAGGAAIAVTAPAYRLADATPLVHTCGGDSSPRFQLLELTPRIGASFDPSLVGDRALALLDVEAGTLAWTSRKLTGLHHPHAAQPPVCRGGHYFLPIELTDRAGQAVAALWIVDAETGKTAAAVGFDAELGASLADVTADQLDGERIVGVGARGVFDLAWRVAGHGLHDARAELQAVLGPLP